MHKHDDSSCCLGGIVVALAFCIYVHCTRTVSRIAKKYIESWIENVLRLRDDGNLKNVSFDPI